MSCCCLMQDENAHDGVHRWLMRGANDLTIRTVRFHTLECPFVWGKRGTKRVLEYARLAMEFAHVRASRYGTR